MKKFKVDYLYQNLFIGCLVILIGIGILFLGNWYQAVDNYCYEIIISFKRVWLTNFFIAITNLVDFYSLFIVLLITLIIATKRHALYLITNLITITFINKIMKLLINRPRPINLALINQGGLSFPSAHAMVGTAFYGLIVFFILNSKLKYKNIIALFLIVIILLIGISRIYLGVHYTTDVLAGFVLGVMGAIIYINCYQSSLNKKNKA